TFAAPTLNTISVRSGLAAGGGTVKLTGTNLASASAVRFGQVRASFQTAVVKTVTEITAVVPPNATGGTVPVTVENPAGTSTTTASTTYTYFQPPVLASLSTSTASAVGGTEVTITGTGLAGATAVKLGPTAAKDVKVLSPTSVR